MRILYAPILLTMALALSSVPAAADKLAEVAKGVVKDNKEAVVTIRLVLEERFSFGGLGSEKSESITETTGSVIGKDGLTVASLSATNPMSMISDMLSGLGGDEDLGFQFSVDSDLSDVTLILDNGDEMSADVVLRDRDLDLIFVRPTEPRAEDFRVIDISSDPKVEQFDQLVLLGRLGRVANRSISGSFPRVSAVMEKPRRLYVISGGGAGALGEPAFDMQGNFVGMSAMRKIKSSGPGGGGFMGLGSLSNIGSNMITVIVRAEDILEAAEQAPPAAADE